MLPREHRMVRSTDFAAAVRQGRRAGDGLLVVHRGTADDVATPARVGFVVSRAVGNAVARNRVKRRLRAVVRTGSDRLDRGELVVVRALPASAAATYAELSASFDRCLQRVTDRSGRPAPRRSEAS